MKWKCASVVLAIVFLGSGIARAQEVIKGLDFWETKPGQTFVDLAPLEGVCNFQFPGANSRVILRGIPLESSTECPGHDLGSTNTIIRRLDDTHGLVLGGQANVPIEIVALHLQSVQPFTVVYQGHPEAWMVDVSLPQSLTQPMGQMIVRHPQPGGGTFDSFLPVQPHFIFTRVDPCPAIVRCELNGPVIQLQTVGAPWSYQPQPLSPVLQIPGCTTNFFPGVIPFEPGLETGGPPNPGACHAGPSNMHQHCVTPPPPPKLHQHDWQMAVHFTFWLQNISPKGPINDFHFRNPRYIAMNVAAARPDSSVFIKSVSICDTSKVCSKAPPDRWARVNWDSTDTNFRKEAWWIFPPVPPGQMAPEMDVVFSVPCYAQPDAGAWYEVDYQCTNECAVVDSGTFRFHCPPMPPCTDQPGCKNGTVNLIGVPQGPKGQIDMLKQNVPNPFTAPTTIRYRVDREASVSLRVFDPQGRVIRTLVRGQQTSGERTVEWNGRDDAGNLVKAGTYFYQIEVGGVRQAKKMIRLK